MSIFRKIGIMILIGVPAIIGGGIVYHFSPNTSSVVIYEVILIAIFIGLISK